MTFRQTMTVIGVWGLVTVLALVIGLHTVGGVLALVQLGGLVGAPLALILNRQLRSVPAVVALSIALSLALSALAVQSLIWFGVANRSLLVLTATAYGLVLSFLLSETGPGRPELS